MKLRTHSFNLIGSPDQKSIRRLKGEEEEGGAVGKALFPTDESFCGGQDKQHALARMADGSGKIHVICLIAGKCAISCRL